MQKIHAIVLAVVSMLFAANMAIAGTTECSRVGDKLHCTMHVDAQKVEVAFAVPSNSDTIEKLLRSLRERDAMIADLRHEVKLLQDEKLDLLIETIRLKKACSK